jgi:hypothetical protein
VPSQLPGEQAGQFLVGDYVTAGLDGVRAEEPARFGRVQPDQRCDVVAVLAGEDRVGQDRDRGQ